MSWLAALIPLDNYGHYISWHFIEVSVANLTVIILMIVNGQTDFCMWKNGCMMRLIRQGRHLRN